MIQKKTLVIGASTNPARYSYKAIQSLVNHKHPVLAFGLRKGIVNEIVIETELPSSIENLDTITLYIGPSNQPPIYADIIRLKPNRVIFNPGTENAELEELLTRNKIAFERSCTLVLLSLGNY
jgi:predicted CoA-binding protein